MLDAAIAWWDEKRLKVLNIAVEWVVPKITWMDASSSWRWIVEIRVTSEPIDRRKGSWRWPLLFDTFLGSWYELLLVLASGSYDGCCKTKGRISKCSSSKMTSCVQFKAGNCLYLRINRRSFFFYVFLVFCLRDVGTELCLCLFDGCRYPVTSQVKRKIIRCWLF